ncbi:ABC transporter substrate-binding protein [Aromatoleum diolicum]|uniref:PhnD/SsuA/transferrin family substrate-binding protein n=1 Tax=Aromatoleum diolicum TaxID=75796 RepID=A0ABX1QEL7_9RHOO|nr:ABC transporter substrate-binding protein [Aromatoleum diolicum]NMG75629.1 PhnD/SsuA/transferrin family substrate-binding protein [Aromatoleum diolicum]
MRPDRRGRLPTLRAAFETTGSGCWLMRAILDGGLDRANGYRLALELGDDRMRGGRQATEARLIAGEVDLIDTDWLSLARHRAAGLPLAAAAPYGTIFGGLVAPRDGALRSLADLKGRRIGVVHAQDKNWLLLRAACRQHHDFDPAVHAQCVATGSKTALRQALQDGQVDAALLYWHQVPAQVANGDFVEVCDLVDLLNGLPGGVAAAPSTFFVFRDAMLAAQPELVRAFARSVADAAVRLRADADLWCRVSGVTWDSDDGVGEALRKKWLARIGPPWAPGMTDTLGTLAGLLAGLAPGAARFELPGGIFAAGFLD